MLKIDKRYDHPFDEMTGTGWVDEETYALDWCRYRLHKNSSGACYWQPKDSFHTVIWQKMHKILVPKGGVIHHLDGDKTNNTFENLVMMSNSDHARLHAMEKMGRFRETTCICVVCGKEYHPTSTNSKCCCSECSVFLHKCYNKIYYVMYRTAIPLMLPYYPSPDSLPELLLIAA